MADNGNGKSLQTADCPLSPDERKINSLFRKIHDVDFESVVMKSNCKFCNHPIRELAEEKFEKTGQFVAVERFFEEYRKEHDDAPKMTYDNVIDHLNNHYLQQNKKIRMKAYCEYLSENLNHTMALENKLEMMSQSLLWEYYNIASDNINTKHKADAMTKLSKQWAEIVRLQAELRGDVNKDNGTAQKFFQVFISAIQSETDVVVQQKLTNLLDVLDEQMKDTSIAPAAKE